MKFKTLLLTTYIWLLTVQPVLTAIASVFNVHTEESCGDSFCMHEQQESKQTKQDQSGVCNPFLACAYCLGCY